MASVILSIIISSFIFDVSNIVLFNILFGSKLNSPKINLLVFSFYLYFSLIYFLIFSLSHGWTGTCFTNWTFPFKVTNFLSLWRRWIGTCLIKVCRQFYIFYIADCSYQGQFFFFFFFSFFPLDEEELVLQI